MWAMLKPVIMPLKVIKLKYKRMQYISTSAYLTAEGSNWLFRNTFDSIYKTIPTAHLEAHSIITSPPPHTSHSHSGV